MWAIGAKILGFLTARPALAAMLGLSLVAGFFFIQDQRHSRQLAEAHADAANKKAADAALVLARKERDYELLSAAHTNLAIAVGKWEPSTNSVIKEIHIAQANSKGECFADPAMQPLRGLHYNAGSANPGKQGSPSSR